MEFDKEAGQHISGKKFSDGVKIIIANDNEPLIDRFEIIESICKNKKVIHLGCVDHLPLIDQKREKNLWLHSRLCECSSKCLGIDINKEGIEYVRSIGFKDVVYANILTDTIDEIEQKYWDYLIMGEVLEHIDDPCYFLKKIKERYSNNIDKLIISVPNAFSWQNISSTFSNVEYINSDHRFWFTPFTLAKIVFQAGMNLENFYFCQSIDNKRGLLTDIIHPTKIFYKLMYKKCPATRLTLLAIVKL